MTPAVLRIEGLPEAPLAAAAEFHARWLPRVSTTSNLVLIFPPADHTHTAWRLAAVQSLAREAAPGRVNALVGGDDAAIAEALDYLDRAPGVTGQILTVDGNSTANR